MLHTTFKNFFLLVRGLRLNQPASHPADPDILADAGP